jgi:hypothetical protein
METQAAGKALRGRWLRRGGALAMALACAGALACVTPAELRKVSNRVTDLERGRGGGGAGDPGRVADLAAEVEALSRAIEALDGRLDETEHRVQQALDEARAARSEANTIAAPGAAQGATPDGEQGETE